MSFTEFLKLVSTIKLLYGTQFASRFFTKNISLYYDLNSESILTASKLEQD